MDSSESVRSESLLLRYHNPLSDVYADVIYGLLQSDTEFEQQLERWAEKTGSSGDIEHIVGVVSDQYAYHKLISELFSSIADLQDLDVKSSKELLLGSLPCSPAVDSLVDEFVTRVKEQESTIETETIDEIYQSLLTQSERRNLGQFYTPPEIASLLSSWTIRDKEDRVLDPCCGTGVITRSAYERLVDLGATRAEADENLRAFDVNEFSATTAAYTFAIDSESNNHPISVENFFNVRPDLRDGSESVSIPQVDATVGNPPYVRHEELGDSGSVRSHLSYLGRGSVPPYSSDGDKALSERTDLYCYFLTHATEFLVNGGRLGWIIPTKWMVSEYGKAVRQFIYDHYKVHAVVSIDETVFDDALVDTVLLFLEREVNPDQREETTTTFVSLNKIPDCDDIHRFVKMDAITSDELVRIETSEGERTVSVHQHELSRLPDGDIYYYLNAPPSYIALREHPETTPLSSLGNLTYGKKTGANDIFLLTDEEQSEWGIERDVLYPAVKSIRDVDGLHHTKSDSERWLLSIPSSELSPSVRGIKAVDEAGFQQAASYLQSVSEHPDVGNESLDNERWFDLGYCPSAPVCIPLAMDVNRSVIQMDEDIIPVNRFALFEPTNASAEEMLAILNSNTVKMCLESRGRVTGGGAINFAVSDLADMQVPDPRLFSDESRLILKEKFAKLKQGDKTARQEIDQVILEELDIEISVETVVRASEQLKRRRRGDDWGAWNDVEYTVEKVKSGQRTLDSFYP